MPKDNFDSKVAKFWDRESGDWGEKYRRRTSYYYRCRTIYDFFLSTDVGNASILDYGCGSGDISFPMLQDGHSVTGVDIAERMVVKARAHTEEFGLSARASYHHLSDGVLEEISSLKFDVVVCSSVLEYVENDMSLLRMFHAVLRPGGFLLVSVPDRRSLFCRLDRWMHENRRLMPGFIPVEKLGYLDVQKHQYDIGKFIEEVERTGFRLRARKHNTITLQRGALMERISNIPGIGMLAIMMFRKNDDRQ